MAEVQRLQSVSPSRRPKIDGGENHTPASRTPQKRDLAAALRSEQEARKKVREHAMEPWAVCRERERERGEQRERESEKQKTTGKRGEIRAQPGSYSTFRAGSMGIGKEHGLDPWEV